LEALGSRVNSSPAAKRLARLLEVCCLFVERWESSPYEGVDFQRLIAEMKQLAGDGAFEPVYVELISRLPSVNKAQITAVCGNLLVMRPTAVNFLRLMATPDPSLDRLAELICQDQELRRDLLRIGNPSGLDYRIPVRMVLHALSAVGVEQACRLLLSNLLRPYFQFAEDRVLWKHSLQVANLASRMVEQIAENGERLTPPITPLMAYLGGLIHDIGRLALHHLPPEGARRYARLVSGGAERQFAEVLLCGFDHCVAGVEALRRWDPPELLVDAVAHHHDPENSPNPLPSVLYLAEHASASEEDIPSAARLHLAEERIKLPKARLEESWDRHLRILAG